MKIEILDEGLGEWTDNSLRFQNIDITTKLGITDKLEDVDKKLKTVKFIIGLNLEVETKDNKKVISGIFIGQYRLTIEGDMTYKEFSNFYKQPYNSFKEYFDNYKKGKHIEIIEFPSFDKDLNLVLSAFKERIPDLLSD